MTTALLEPRLEQRTVMDNLIAAGLRDESDAITLSSIFALERQAEEDFKRGDPGAVSAYESIGRKKIYDFIYSAEQELAAARTKQEAAPVPDKADKADGTSVPRATVEPSLLAAPGIGIDDESSDWWGIY